jgi:preprotein translocase subunit SecY
LLSAAVDAFRTPDLRRKLLLTFGMLVASRFIPRMPIPCADLTARRFLRRLFEGALSSLSVAALGVYPYTTAHLRIRRPAPHTCSDIEALTAPSAAALHPRKR